MEASLSYVHALRYVDDGMASCDRMVSFLTRLADRELAFAADIAQLVSDARGGNGNSRDTYNNGERAWVAIIDAASASSMGHKKYGNDMKSLVGALSHVSSSYHNGTRTKIVNERNTLNPSATIRDDAIKRHHQYCTQLLVNLKASETDSKKKGVTDRKQTAAAIHDYKTALTIAQHHDIPVVANETKLVTELADIESKRLIVIRDQLLSLAVHRNTLLTRLMAINFECEGEFKQIINDTSMMDNMERYHTRIQSTLLAYDLPCSDDDITNGSYHTYNDIPYITPLPTLASPVPPSVDAIATIVAANTSTAAVAPTPTPATTPTPISTPAASVASTTPTTTPVPVASQANARATTTTKAATTTPIATAAAAATRSGAPTPTPAASAKSAPVAAKTTAATSTTVTPTPTPTPSSSSGSGVVTSSTTGVPPPPKRAVASAAATPSTPSSGVVAAKSTAAIPAKSNGTPRTDSKDTKDTTPPPSSSVVAATANTKPPPPVKVATPSPSPSSATATATPATRPASASSSSSSSSMPLIPSAPVLPVSDDDPELPAPPVDEPSPSVSSDTPPRSASLSSVTDDASSQPSIVAVPTTPSAVIPASPSVATPSLGATTPMAKKIPPPPPKREASTPVGSTTIPPSSSPTAAAAAAVSASASPSVATPTASSSTPRAGLIKPQGGRAGAATPTAASTTPSKKDDSDDDTPAANSIAKKSGIISMTPPPPPAKLPAAPPAKSTTPATPTHAHTNSVTSVNASAATASAAAGGSGGGGGGGGGDIGTVLKIVLPFDLGSHSILARDCTNVGFIKKKIVGKLSRQGKVDRLNDDTIKKYSVRIHHGEVCADAMPTSVLLTKGRAAQPNHANKTLELELVDEAEAKATVVAPVSSSSSSGSSASVVMVSMDDTKSAPLEHLTAGRPKIKRPSGRASTRSSRPLNTSAIVGTFDPDKKTLNDE